MTLRGFRIIVAVLSLAATAGLGYAAAGNLQPTTGSETLRNAAVVTSSDVNATTKVVVSNSVDAAHLYFAVTTTGADSIVVTPCGSFDGGITYYGNQDYQTTYTKSGNYHIRIPREAIGGSRLGCYARGNGALTTTSLAIMYKPEQ